jgi:T4 beta protein
MSIKSYVPILRPKQGEIFAIQNLSEVAQSRITPFFDVHRVPIKNGKKEKILDEHFYSIIKRICKCWPTEREFFWDLFSIDLTERLQNGKHPVIGFGEILYGNNMKTIPTMGTERDEAYLNAVRNLLNKGFTDSICIRILRDDLETPKETIIELEKLLKSLGISQSACHLLIDMRVVKESLIGNIIETVSEFTSEWDMELWKTFTFSSASFPIDMKGLQPDSDSRVPRVELKVWNALMEAEHLIGRKSNFSDYGITNPEKPDLDLSKIRAGGKIRYTTENDWIIVKGHLLNKGKRFNQYRDLSRKVMNFPEYRGTGYSWGDNFLEKCSQGKGGTGNLTTWVEVDTNHHLTLVGEQISNLCGSSDKN